MPEDYKLEVIITAKDQASKAIKKLSGGLGDLDKESKKAKISAGNVGTSLKTIATTAAMGVGAVVAVGAAMKKAFDLGKEGAAIQQTEESFEGLLYRIGAAPDLLDDLRSASRNTVSDLDLMASTTTLLAGAQGELATQLAAATPELMEIAKAANKLNPTLGDTTFMYQSLATGVKRAQPLILDNLGLTIKVGEANERYAEMIGKTVEQLTAEEQKIALLNETRRAGRVLIDQAGGAAESAMDDFERLEAATENLSNAFKKKLAPAVGAVADALADMLTFQQRLQELVDAEAIAIDELTLTYEDYLKARQAQAKELNLEIDANGDLIKVATIYTGLLDEQGTTLREVVREKFLLSEATWEQLRAAKQEQQELEALGQAYYKYGHALGDLGEQMKLVEEERQKSIDRAERYNLALRGSELAMEGVIDKEKALESQIQRTAYEQELFNASLSELDIAIGGVVGRQLEDFTETQGDLAVQTATAREELEELETQLVTMPRGLGIGRWRGELAAIEEEMHALGPEPAKLDREREATMRGLEVAHLEADKALQGQLAAAGAYGATTERVQELRDEIAELEGQMRDAQAEHERETESIIYNLAQQSIEASGLIERMGQPAVDLQWELAEALGQIDERTLQAWTATQKINQLYADDVISLDKAVELYKELTDLMAQPPEIAEPDAAIQRTIAYYAQAPLIEVEIAEPDVAFEDMIGRYAQAQPVEIEIAEPDVAIADKIAAYAWERERAALEVSGLPPGMQTLFDEIEDARLTAIPEEIESEIVIENLDPTLEAFKVMDGIVDSISGTHSVAFAITTRGEWPGMGGGGNGGGPPPSGGPPYGPGSEYESFQSGGIVQETGLVYAHAGELIIPPMEAQQVQQGGGGGTTVTHGDTNNFNLNVTSVQELTSIIQEYEVMRAMVG